MRLKKKVSDNSKNYTNRIKKKNPSRRRKGQISKISD